MAFDISGIMGVALGWFSSTIFWIIVTFIIVTGFFLALWVRKKRALLFRAYDVSFLKDGKMVMEETKAGWFGRKKILFGLLDVGKNKVMRLKDGRIVNDFSVDDYHEYRNKGKARRCIVVTSHPEDKTIVVPITNVNIDQKSLTAIYEVAPADYREAAVAAFEESASELRGQLDRLLPYILLGGIVIFFIIGIIVNGQIISRSVDSAKEILSDAGNTLEQIANLVSSRPSTGPGTPP